VKVVIIGTGIIGLTLAKELLDNGCYVTIIEKEPTVGVHASGRNSGVLHSGIYYPKDTLKAAFCTDGKPLLKAFCETYNVDIDQCGKVLVTKTKDELAGIELLYQRGTENGIKVERLSKSALEMKDPFAKTVGEALWIEETAVFDSKEILKRLIDYVKEHQNGTVLFNESFKSRIDDTSIQTNNQKLGYDLLINCAGGYADKIAHKFDVAHHLKLIPFKGIYKKLNKNIAKKVNHHIYPVPDLENPFLGVHFTKSISGDVYVGPTAIPAFGAENYGIFENLGIESLNILAKDAILFLTNEKFRRVALTEPKRYIHKFFYDEARRLVQELNPTDLEASSKIGIRPQLVNWKTKELVMDFSIEKKENHIHILNAISPAFTCCFAFAKHVIKNYLD